MKISCQSCQAKYTIADDKVLGKIVKIRCKKCGETIVVNGSGATGEAIAASAYPEVPGAQGAPGEEPWTVNVADGDQRTMTEPEIVAAYQTGVISDETYCWRDGMADWLPLREIDALQDACGATRAMTAPSELQRPPGVGPAPAAQYASGGGGNGAANRQEQAAAAPSATARRAGGRAPTGDLFGGVAQAGSEEDVMTSAPAGMPQARGGESDKMVGERNENSVLFSLSALTSKGPGGPPKPAAPGIEASGLIDIKQLSAQLHIASEKKRSGIDDIMNLAGGGAFSPSLTAPTLLTAPSLSEYSADGRAGAAPGKSRGLIFLALGGGALFIVAAIGAAVMLMSPKGTEAADKAAASASAAENAMASAAASGAAPLASSAPSASAAASAAPTETAAPKATETKTATTTTKTATATAAATTPPKETSLAAAMAGTPPAAAPATPAPQAGADQAFNMGEAKARLAAAASAAQGCKKPDGPTGSGRVVVMFAPSGAAQSATVTGPPFEGTPTGACVAARFRGVRVPAFGGSPFSVSKSFSVN